MLDIPGLFPAVHHEPRSLPPGVDRNKLKPWRLAMQPTEWQKNFWNLVWKAAEMQKGIQLRCPLSFYLSHSQAHFTLKYGGLPKSASKVWVNKQMWHTTVTTSIECNWRHFADLCRSPNRCGKVQPAAKYLKHSRSKHTCWKDSRLLRWNASCKPGDEWAILSTQHQLRQAPLA